MVLVRLACIACLSSVCSTAIPAANSAAQAPPATDVQGAGSLSDKLSTSKGVIQPRTDVDSKMPQAAPQTQTTMPVIPPTGGPRSDQSVQPK